MGLTATGFEKKRYADIVSEKEARAIALFGDSINLGSDSPLGVFIRLNAYEESLLWTELENVYYSAYVDTAEGESLDSVAKYIGITRRQAVRATGAVTFTGTNGFVIGSGTLVETVDGVQYETIANVTVAGGTAAANIRAVIAGTDGNVAIATVTVITNPVAQLTAVTNAAAISGGLEVETDTEFRVRYRRSVALAGAATANSIEATILNVDGVLDARVLVNNTTDNPDLQGLPTKSIGPVVFGGADQDIGEAIYSVKAAGIQSAGIAPGDVTVNVADNRGVLHPIAFTRPTEIDIYVEVELTVDTNFPAAPPGVDQVRDAIEAYIVSRRLGDDIIFVALYQAIMSIPGIVDVPVLLLDIVDPPLLAANIPIGITEVSVVGRVDVTAP